MMRLKLSVFLTIVVSVACKQKGPDVVIRTDRDSLLSVIELGFEPIEVKWAVYDVYPKRERSSPGPDDYDLFVIAKVSLSDKAMLAKNISRSSNISDEVYLDSNFVKDWFTPSVKSMFISDGQYFRTKDDVYDTRGQFESVYQNGFYFLTKTNELFIYVGSQ